MKIGFVAPMNVIAGGLFVVYKQAHHLKEIGHDVSIIFVSEKKGIEVTHYPQFSLKTTSLVAAAVDPKNYDIVIATWWETYFDMFRIPAKHHIYFCQSDERRFYTDPSRVEPLFVELTYLEKQVGFITEAKWIKYWLENDYGVTVKYAPNGIDNQLFNPRVKPKVAKTEKVRVLIEGPGSISYKKIDLAFKVTNQFKNIEVMYASNDGFVKPEWQYNYLFTMLPLQEMPAIYTSCDILLKLSSVEGFFGPPLEMMACGGTAVVSDVTGFDEYIVDGKNALVVPIDDEAKAVAALGKLIDDASLRKQLSENGLKTARELDWKSRMPLFSRAIEELCTRPPTTSLDFRYRNIILGQVKDSTIKHREIEQRLVIVENFISKVTSLGILKTYRFIKRITKSKTGSEY
jgi:glycosyltransferase involved in cell wall biosynthesis